MGFQSLYYVLDKLVQSMRSSSAPVVPQIPEHNVEVELYLCLDGSGLFGQQERNQCKIRQMAIMLFLIGGNE